MKFLSIRFLEIFMLILLSVVLMVFTLQKFDHYSTTLEAVYVIVGLLGLHFVYRLKMKTAYYGWFLIFVSFYMDLLDEFKEIKLPDKFNYYHEALFLTGLILFIYGIFQEVVKKEKEKDRLQYIAEHDSLTGIHNRTYFMKISKTIATEDKLPLGVILVDLNGLKFINDSFGHNVGDKLLVKTAKLLEKAISSQNHELIRFGGDEFLMIFTKADEFMLKNAVSKIDKACKETQFYKVPISVAIGSAIMKDANDSFDETIRLADDRMYMDKLVNKKSIGNVYINSLKKTLEEKSYETSEHEKRMERLANIIGRYLKLDKDQMTALTLAATFHDIGKIAIAENIVMKPASLDSGEWQLMKRHPEIGARIIGGVFTMPLVEKAILAHHERWDGKGYPNGLKGAQIPVIARIITMVDSFDVMVQGRPYQNPKSMLEALEELKKCAGKQFDLDLVEIFFEIIERDYLNIKEIINIVDTENMGQLRMEI